jgi:hypothetical protein
MFRVVKVPGGVFVLGRVATSDIPAYQAHAQVNPGIAGLHALVAHVLGRGLDFDLIEVSTLFWHRFSPGVSG